MVRESFSVGTKELKEPARGEGMACAQILGAKTSLEDFRN